MSVPSNEFQKRLTHVAHKMESVLDEVLPIPYGPQMQIMEAMRYAVLGGGKRLRPFLVIESARMFGLDPDEDNGVWLAAAALECVHVYSLIHDDLPCMDDDDLRRGKPTVHKKYDEAMAVLTGDALLTLAFQILAQDEVVRDPNLRLELIADLASASGVYGMIGGQVMDIYADGEDREENHIQNLQALKTGALIQYAAQTGAKLQGASKDDLQNLERYAQALGLAFQIRDDILDTEGDAAEMGKAAGKDAGLGKATFVSIHGLENAKMLASKLGKEAKLALSGYGDKAAALIGAVDFVLERKK